jgi:MoaA/NifB/PqqE/SkfB family radical SAM enzyme
MNTRTASEQFLQAIRKSVQGSIRFMLPGIVRLLPLRIDRSEVTSWAMIELTSKCNLRCVYCGKSTSREESRRSFDFPEEKIQPAMQLLQKRGMRLVYMSGIGESTIRKGWDRIFRGTLETKVAHTIITNLARPLSDAEAGVLARFGSVQVSVDTADEELFSQIRRKGKLSVVIDNMERIRNVPLPDGVRRAKLRFDMVITDKTVHGLEATVKLGLQHGVTDFYFAGLYKMNDVPGAVNVNHVKTLPHSELGSALQALENAIRLARESGSKVQVHDGLLDSIRIALAAQLQKPELQDANQQIEGPRWEAPSLEAGFTRNCLDPWNFVFLYAQGEVRPCCAYNKGVGNVNESPLKDILNGPGMVQMRQNLVLGALNGMMCAHCSMRSPIKVESFKQKVKQLRVKGLCYRFLGKKLTDWLGLGVPP